MKKLHLIPSEKPSSLFKVNNELQLTRKYDFYNGAKYQNIYITNSEEIKEGDYNVPSDFSKISDISKTSKEDLQVVNEKNNGYKKIILTTDQDLIADGVQAISDEFLEWFVKNPSCEEVEVEPLLSNNGKALFGYKIIIPEEEPYDRTYQPILLSDVEKSTQETLELPDEIIFANEVKQISEYDKGRWYGRIEGAKWQQENILQLLKDNDYQDEPVFELLTEQFKKK
jgi:hypothetical protein